MGKRIKEHYNERKLIWKEERTETRRVAHWKKSIPAWTRKRIRTISTRKLRWVNIISTKTWKQKKRENINVQLRKQEVWTSNF